jgi:catechol 2,3-dioxygenase-like lactoylglutathione lyase family enzyme
MNSKSLSAVENNIDLRRRDLRDLVVRPHHTAISCRDWDRAKSFFVDLLGFKVVGEIARREEENLGIVSGLPGGICRFAMLERAGYHIELLKWIHPQGEKVELRQCDIGIVHLCIEVTDSEKVRKLLVAEGYESISDVQVLRGGRAKVFYCKGPDAVVVEFLELVPMQSWSETDSLNRQHSGDAT